MGQLGVVSGTAIDNVFVRRLQDHGIDGELQTALDCFRLRVSLPTSSTNSAPCDERVRRRIAASGIDARQQGRSIDAIVLASFIEVKLAKMGTTASSESISSPRSSSRRPPRCVVRFSPASITS